MSNVEDFSVEDMLDLVDPVMDMVDAAIDEIEDAEHDLQECLSEADMIMVDCEADKMESVPGFMLGMEEETTEETDPYENIALF